MTATEFFLAEAGYCYDPAKETVEEGRQRCAERLAKAEAWASENGYSFQWEIDEEYGEGPLWLCLCHDADGKVAESLGGVEFAGDDPWINPTCNAYRRVVEAELALEAMPE